MSLVIYCLCCEKEKKHLEVSIEFMTYTHLYQVSVIISGVGLYG
jgi:hypothetical protein